MCKRIFSVMMIIIMLSTTNGVVTFANSETTAEETTAEGTTVGEDIEESDVEADIEETSVGANCVSPEDEETEDETMEENETGSQAHPYDTTEEEETETTKEATTEENGAGSQAHPYNTTEEEETETTKEATTEENGAGSQAHPYDTTEDETEVDVEQDEVIKDIEYRANNNTVRFDVNPDKVESNSGFVYTYFGNDGLDYSDADINGYTAFKNKNVGDTITIPTVTINSTEASKGLSFLYWKNSAGTQLNNGGSRTITQSDLDSKDYYAYFTDNRRMATFSIYSDSEEHVSFNDFEGGGVVLNSNGIGIKHPITDTALGRIMDHVVFNSGWGLDCYVDASGNTVDPKTWNRSNNVTYYIKAKTVGTPVSFNLGGHGTIDNQVITAGEKVTKPDDPVVTGYTFKGWYKEDTYTTTWNFSTDTVGSDPVVIYGKFEENEYSITYNRNGGTFKDGYNVSTSRKYTEAITLPTADNIEKTGYTFSGWYENEDFSGSAVTSIAANTAENKIYYLKWIEKEYSITLNNNGGTYEGGYTAPITRLYSSATTLPTNANITKTGYTFVGWYANAEFSGSAVTSIAANTAEDKTYYLKWNENEYNVSVNLNGGSYTNGYTLTNTKRKYSESFTLPTNVNVEKLGHTFGGWYDNAEFTGSSLTTINANTASDKTLYAKWTANEYNITFNLNGGSIKSGNITKYTYGEGATLPNDVEGLSDLEQFAGWYEQSDFSGARVYTISKTDMGDKEYFAKYGKVYKVSFDPGEGEGSMDTVSVEEGKNYNAPACSFTHATLVFDKWQGSDGKTYNKNAPISLSANITLTALFKEPPAQNSSSGNTAGGSSRGGAGIGGGGGSTSIFIIPNTHYWEGMNDKWRGRDIFDGTYVYNTWKFMNYAGSTGWYYFGLDGYILSGWQNINGYKYYLEKEIGPTFGVMYTGERIVDGVKCKFADNGIFEGYVY